MKRKILGFILVLSLVMSTSTINAQSKKEDNLTKIFEKNIDLSEDSEKSSAMKDGKKSNKADAKLEVFLKNGKKKVYSVSGEMTKKEKMKAFKLLNKFMEKGSVERTNVYCSEYNKDYYGNEMDESNLNSDCIGYTWSKYNAGNVRNGGVDTSWGGSSGVWDGLGSAEYITLLQSRTICVTTPTASLNISWPPGVSVSTSRTTSTATDSTTKANTDVLGAEHSTVEMDWQDLGYGFIDYVTVSDTAKIGINNFEYKASTAVKFISN